MIYLYLKTHNITGLKYLGKTIKDPFKYNGSGKYWSRHIKKYGYNVTTEIIKECETNEEIKYWGLYYSHLWDIIVSKDFANLKYEEGDGGGTGNKGACKGKKHTTETKNKISESLKGHKDSTETIEMRRNSNIGKKRSKKFCKDTSNRLLGSKRSKESILKQSKTTTGVKKSEKHKENISKSKKGVKSKTIECPYCGKIGSISNMKRWHFDNCKQKI